ncbi:hypothetical protein KV205_23395 [Streptomyces sp. SKN60]|uniref:hypothetical protein n=1 Tax=Streptomyces sp. SKN60 TaxID=2855506 RepID=UPI002245B8F9|nr:hypothetical protein [Streptomyces sp. SKN60]MCX2183451.1 hypothetical protein [Streptomyces sp. SKN60]
MITAIVTACASILIAIIAYWLNHQGESRRSQREARIDRVSSQLRDLYGPLLVLTETNEKAWSEYCRRYITPTGVGPAAVPLSELEEARWRTWVEAVFAPAAQKMREVITTRGDLIVEGEMPPVVLEFCAHAATYEALLANWGGAGPSKSTLVRHPGSRFLSYVRESYGSLKAEHALLLKTVRDENRIGSSNRRAG